MRCICSRWMRPAGRVLAIVAAASGFATSLAAAENPGTQKPGSETGTVAGRSDKPADIANPIVQLVRDPAVQKELGLAELQTAAVSGAYAKIRPRLWLLRDVSAGPGAVEKAELLATMERDLGSLLQPTQLDRLQQLVARARGWPGITAEPSATRLKLTALQIDKITAINTKTLGEIQRIASSNDAPAARNTAMQTLRTQEGTAIQKLLSSDQRQALRQLVGAAYDLSHVQPLYYEAPDLEQVDAWLNSQPLEMSRLRGRVVAFHFWAFGCINCIRNLPHYNKWHEELADDGLVVLGMHTPETQAERSVDRLRSKVDAYKIRYPVAVDHKNANWAAWANSMWPSVYLVDKNGQVRYWWYGELNWQGGNGEAFMRQRIEELLDE